MSPLAIARRQDGICFDRTAHVSTGSTGQLTGVTQSAVVYG